MEPIIEFQNFSFKYRSQKEPTLKDINLAIYPGEKVLIVGPSGSGKSTLAHCINGLVPFSYAGDITGTYRIKGEDPAKLGIFGLSKSVGTVLQDTDGQFIGLTVAEDIAFALENDRVEYHEMRGRVDKAADAVDVKDLLDHAPGALSGGQKQRVSMAGVLVCDVEILLFDEPLANLDPATGKRTIALIDELQKAKGATILIIEHRLEDALYRDVDRIIVVGEGKIVADTTPDELLAANVLAGSHSTSRRLSMRDARSVPRRIRRMWRRWNCPVIRRRCAAGTRRLHCRRKNRGMTSSSRWRILLFPMTEERRF